VWGLRDIHTATLWLLELAATASSAGAAHVEDVDSEKKVRLAFGQRELGYESR
jgi:hypothetical protein